MSNVIAFKKPKKARKSNTMCQQGHHKWDIVQEKQFDVKQGKLVTLYQCRYCKMKKTQAL